MRRSLRALGFEACELRIMPTLVFILNGNSFAATHPNALTANAAAVLRADGEQPVQLSTPAISTPRAFNLVARSLARLSHGQPFGIVGFSSGGVLAARLAGVASLNVKAVLDYYGEPDLKIYLASHGRDAVARNVLSHGRFTKATIDLLSGPSPATAYVVAAFGSLDRNVVPALNIATLQANFANSKAYVYPGPHDSPITASPAALEDFLNHLE